MTLDPTRTTLAAAALAILVALTSCHHAATGLDGAARGDTNTPQTDTGSHHFDPCTMDVDCPGGDHCSAPDATPPSGDTAAPKQCRPPCAMDSDCVVPLAGITLAAACGDDHYCVGWCSPSMPFLPMCDVGVQCHVFPGLQQGYCFLPAP